MRARDFQEAVNPAILRPDFERKKVISTARGPITLVARYHDDPDRYYPQFMITAHNTDGRKVGYTRFNISNLYHWLTGKKPWPKKANIFAGMVLVQDDYQKLGIAREMYKFAKELGNDVAPSDVQTDKGRRMWDSFKRDQVFEPAR